MANVNCKWSLSGLEALTWTVQSGPTINPTPATQFLPEQLPGELLIFCSGPKFAGALVKNTQPLVWPSRLITFNYAMKHDDSIAFGQVAETDFKLTDAAKWTYDCSFQWNVAKGWMAQINNPWVDTGYQKQPAQDVWNPNSVQWLIDYTAHTSQLVSVNGNAVTTPPIPAKQMGWNPNELVTQLQLCTAGQGGAYTLRFGGIGFQGSDS